MMNPATPSSWWHEAFARLPYERFAPGENQRLTLVACDANDSKRLSRVTKVCEDFGLRVQCSLFECRLVEAE